MVLCLKKVLKVGCGWVRNVPNCTGGAKSSTRCCAGIDGSVLQAEWRNILLAASPFLMYLFVFKYYAFLREYSGMSEITKPNYQILPYLEETVFQCQPHRKLAAYANPVFDFLAAIPYLVHFPLPAFFGIYLYVVPHRRKQLYSFLWCAGWVNFLAVIVQFVFPTAPPWFTDSAVFDESGHLISVANNEAGFERLDILFNMKLFHNIYGASPVKFGAMPSLHVAWPTIILVCKPWFSDTVGILHVVWISWAALYSNHHYGVDAMAGIFLVFFVNYCMTRIYCPFPYAAPPAPGLPWTDDASTLSNNSNNNTSNSLSLGGNSLGPSSSSSSSSSSTHHTHTSHTSVTITSSNVSSSSSAAAAALASDSANALLRARPNSQSMPVIAPGMN